MSTAEEWDFTVPDDDAELLAELRRHGVRPGVRVHFATSATGAGSDEPPRSPGSDDASDRENLQVQTKDKSRRRHLSFAGLIDAETDLAENADEYLRGFGSR